MSDLWQKVFSADPNTLYQPVSPWEVGLQALGASFNPKNPLGRVLGAGSGLVAQEMARRRMDPLSRQMALQQRDVQTVLGAQGPGTTPGASPPQFATRGDLLRRIYAERPEFAAELLEGQGDVDTPLNPPQLPAPLPGVASATGGTFAVSPEVVGAGLRQGLGWQAFGVETPVQRTQRESAEIQRQTGELQLTEAREQVRREQQFRAGLSTLDPNSQTYVRDLIGLQQRTGVGPSSEIVRNAQSALSSEQLATYREYLNEIRTEAREQVRREQQFRAGLSTLDPNSQTYVRDLIGLQQRTGVGPSSEIVRNAQQAFNSEQLNEYKEKSLAIQEENRNLRRQLQEDQVIPLQQFVELAKQMEGTGQTLLNQKVQLPDGKIVRMSTKEQNLAQAYLEAALIPDPEIRKKAMEQIGASIGARAVQKFGGPGLPAPVPSGRGPQPSMGDAELQGYLQQLIQEEKRRLGLR